MMMDDDTKKLYIQLVEAGRFDDAASLQEAFSGPRVGGLELGERGEMVSKAKAIGMDSSDLFVPEEGAWTKFVADMGYGFQQQGLGAQQLAEHLIPGRDTQDIDERVRAAQEEYQETGLADDVTGGQLMANVIPAIGGGVLLRGATAAAPIRTAMGLGAAEEAVQPVDDENFLTEKAKQVGFGATVGAATELPMGAVRTVEEAKNLPGTVVESLGRPSRREDGGMLRGAPGEQAIVRQVGEETGIDFTPGQVSQSGALQQVEELARSGLFTRNKVQAADVARAGQYDDYIKEFRDTLGPDAPIETVAPKVQAWGRERADELINKRRQAADEDYAPIVQYDGGYPSIPSDNYRFELENIVAEGQTAGASEDMVRAARVAEARLNRLDEQGGLLTGADIDQLTRATGDYTGSAFDVKDVSFDERMTGRIREAVETDAAAVPEIADQLKIAKQNYAKNSTHIDEFEKGLLGQVLGKQFASEVDGVISNTVSPEQLFKKFQTSSPTQITAAMKHMDAQNPGLANAFRSSIIERAREGATFRPAAGGLDTTLDPAAFLRNLGITSGGERGIQGWERLNALFPNNPDAVTNLYRAGLILGDKTLQNTSKTAVATAAREALEAASSLITGSLRKITGTVGAVAGLNQVANAMRTGTQAGVQPMVMGSTRRVLRGGRIPGRAVAGAVDDIQEER
jgi:hypothetical protein